MTEVTLFECDLTGERFGAKNDVIVIPTIHHRNTPGRENREQTYHVALDVVPPTVRVPSFQQYEHVLVTEELDVVGLTELLDASRSVTLTHTRQSQTIEQYVSFLDWLEATLFGDVDAGDWEADP